MKILHVAASVARKLGRSISAVGIAGSVVAIIAGEISFVGDARAATIILSEDFEIDGDDRWGGGTETFGTYGVASPNLPATDYSDSPHFFLPNGGQRYGHLIEPTPSHRGTPTSLEGGPLVSAPIDLTPGHSTIRFDGWLAAYTRNDDYTRFEAEFYSDPNGSGASLGTIVLADGSKLTTTDGVTESIDPNGTIIPGDAGATPFNWKHYVVSRSIPSGAKSVTISYVGDAILANANDAYADNILITTVVPEPSGSALISVGGALTGLRRLRRG